MYKTHVFVNILIIYASAYTFKMKAQYEMWICQQQREMRKHSIEFGGFWRSLLGSQASAWKATYGAIQG